MPCVTNLINFRKLQKDELAQLESQTGGPMLSTSSLNFLLSTTQEGERSRQSRRSDEALDLDLELAVSTLPLISRTIRSNLIMS